MRKEIPPYQTCIRCNKFKPIEEFPYLRDPADGFSRICKDCSKDHVREYSKKKYHVDPEKACQYVEAHRQKYRRKKTEQKGEYIYSPPEERPAGSIRKGCPHCNRHIWILPKQDIVTCKKCRHHFKVCKTLKALDPDAKPAATIRLDEVYIGLSNEQFEKIYPIEQSQSFKQEAL